MPPLLVVRRQVARRSQRRRAVVVPAGAATIPGSLDGPWESGRGDEETVLGLGGRPGAWSGERGYRRRPAAAASARELQLRSQQRRTTALRREPQPPNVGGSVPLTGSLLALPYTARSNRRTRSHASRMRSGVAGASSSTATRCPPTALTASFSAKKADSASISGGSPTALLR